jgi:hypothetical protein
VALLKTLLIESEPIDNVVILFLARPCLRVLAAATTEPIGLRKWFSPTVEVFLPL